jgi:hypothetical protein
MCIELSKEVSLLHQFWGWQRARGPKGRDLTQELNMCEAMKEKESEDSYSLRGNEKWVQFLSSWGYDRYFLSLLGVLVRSKDGTVRSQALGCECKWVTVREGRSGSLLPSQELLSVICDLTRFKHNTVSRVQSDCRACCPQLRGKLTCSVAQFPRQSFSHTVINKNMSVNNNRKG